MPTIPGAQNHLVIDAEFISELPENRFAAFLDFEKRADAIRKALDRNEAQASVDYIIAMNHFAKLYEFENLAFYSDRCLEPDGDFQSYYNTFQEIVSKMRMESVFEYGRLLRDKKRQFPLTAEVRAQIGNYIREIRELINSVEGMPAGKRESIFAALNTLQMEIDADRTRLESVADVAMKIADVGQYVGAKAAPLRELWDRTLKQLERIRPGGSALPSPEAQQQIEGPN